MTASAPSGTTSVEKRLWSVLTYCLVGAVFGLLGRLALGFLTIPLLSGAILQTGFVVCGLRLASWLALSSVPIAEWRWLGVVAIFLIGPLSMEILWANLPFMELQRWQLALAAAAAVSLTSGISFRILSGRFVALAAALVPLGGMLYGLATLSGPLFLPFWIIASITVGGVWLNGSRPRRLSRS